MAYVCLTREGYTYTINSFIRLGNSNWQILMCTPWPYRKLQSSMLLYIHLPGHRCWKGLPPMPYGCICRCKCRAHVIQQQQLKNWRMKNEGFKNEIKGSRIVGRMREYNLFTQPDHQIILRFLFRMSGMSITLLYFWDLHI